MKRSLILISVLSAAAFIFTLVTSVIASSQADDIELVELPLYGDPMKAEGIEMSIDLQMNRHHFWDIKHMPGEDGYTDVDYDHYYLGYSEESTPEPNISIDLFTQGGMSSSHPITREDRMEADGFMLEPAFQMAEEMGPNETRTETVSLADYYEYYPIHIDAYDGMTHGIFDYDEGIQEYFKIPVPAEHLSEYTVETDASGGMTSVNINSVGENDFYLSAVGCVYDDAFYITMSGYGENGDLLDLTQIKGGTGIYRLPYEKSPNRQNIKRGLSGEIEVVFPLDLESCEPIHLVTSPDKSLIYLYAIENGHSVLTVIDTETFEQKQKLDLGKFDWNFNIIQKDDMILLKHYGDDMHLILIKRSEDDVHEVVIDTDLSACEDKIPLDYHTYTAFDYDGERLAVMINQNYWWSCSCYLVVIEDNVPVYAGDYSVNPTENSNNYQYQDRLRYSSDDPHFIGVEIK